jgi:uncharacterized repeat protein (TIGR02543 family)
MDNVVSASAGFEHSMAIKSDGSLWAWGVNGFGQVGTGTIDFQHNPVKIMDDVVAVSAGRMHSMAISRDGAVWAWGNNESGQLGDGTEVCRYSPLYRASIPLSNNSVESAANIRGSTVSVGNFSCTVIRPDGSMWSWWWDNNTWIGPLSNDVVAISEGRGLFLGHTLEIRNDGSLWASGSNREGQLGNGTSEEGRSSNIKVMDNVVAVSAGSGHSMTIRTDGSLWAWGGNWLGQVGDGSLSRRTSPVRIMDDVVAISAGDGHSMAIKSDGSLWAWGGNSSVQIGNGAATDRQTIPVRIMDDVTAISTGSGHSMAIKSDGSLWIWGSSGFGALGTGNMVDSLRSPTKIMDNVIAVSAGSNYSMAIRTDGSLWAWGYNRDGQLGDGTTTNRHSPVRIMDDVIAIAAGDRQSMAIRRNGSLWAWGENSNNPRQIWDSVKMPVGVAMSTPTLTPTPATATLTVRYNANGGSGTPINHSVPIGRDGVARFHLSTTRPTRNGYTFLGWRFENSMDFGIDNPGDSIAFQLGTSDTTFTYYAQWAAIPIPEPATRTLTIRYNANGGSGAPASHSMILDRSNSVGNAALYNLSNTIPTRSGYVFAGWLLDNNPEYRALRAGSSSAEQIGPGETILTFYAQWDVATAPTPPPCPLTPSSPTGTTHDAAAFEREVLRLVNIERANHGLNPLQWDYALAAIARAHSIDMVHRGFFSHNCLGGLSPFDRMRSAGISYRSAAENLAAGQRTPKEVVDGWMNSPGHRANILNPNLTHLGVGFYNYHWTKKFIG